MWILARLRNIRFFSLEELNRQIAPLLAELNRKPFQKREGSRHSLFEAVDRPAMRPLPPHPLRLSRMEKGQGHIDYHVAVHNAFYSVPYRHAGQRVDVCVTDHTVECFLEGKRIAAHARHAGKGRFTTDVNHMPEHHRRYANQRTCSRGPSGLVRAPMSWRERIMARRAHPQQGFRTIQGILKLSETYGEDRLEAAARRALLLGGFHYQSVASMLKNGLDRPTAAR